MLAESDVSRAPSSARHRWSVALACDLLLGLAVAGYVALFAARTISAHLTGSTLFDLATYEQGFWNALGDPPFFYSLEGEMSRFGRHFSPFFYLLLPFYWLRPDPTTLLALQALALALGAVPLYLLAGERLGKPVALAFAIAYLLNPAVHDVNLQNDFHEIAFALPLLLLAFCLGVRGRPAAYACALALALTTREEVALTAAIFGAYLAVFQRRRWLGLATIAVSVAWFAVVAGWVMPAFNAGARFPMPDGYAYLGDSPAGVARGILAHPDVALREMLRRPKLVYVFWLLEPLAFLPLLAPEALAISGLALLEVLVSTFPYHYQVFERYAAPIVPGVFLAGVLGAERLRRRLPTGRPWFAGIALAVLAATVASQAALHKLPTEIQFSPDAHAAVALQVAGAVPPSASVVVEDHRLLPHLAHRRLLYALSPTSPAADYVVFDRKRPPISNVPLPDLRRAEERYLRDPAYSTLRCEDGVYLLARGGAASRDGLQPPRDHAPAVPLASFGDAVRLVGLELDASAARPGGTLPVVLRWQATGRVGADYQVFVHLVDGAGQLRAQHDGAPQDQFCPTSTWTSGLVVRDRHVVALPPELRPGRYEVRVGLYELATLRRLPVAADGASAGDYFAAPVEVQP